MDVPSQNEVLNSHLIETARQAQPPVWVTRFKHYINETDIHTMAAYIP